MSKNATERAKAYTDSGVNIDAGNSLVSRIKNIVSETKTNGVLSDIGGFGGLFKPELSGLDDPVLVSSTDGVGTKLKLAFLFNYHNTIGIDLVAMSVNDILVQGAKPLFFLDYFATGKLNIDTAESVIKGIAEGCKQAGCALLGGETAEMPTMYKEGEYDLAGFCVGIVNNNKIVDGSSIKVGDAIIGLSSSGLHSNGYSLARKIYNESGLKPEDIIEGETRPIKEVLLQPTIIYTEVIRSLTRDLDIKGMVHITGGGFYDNIPRVLPNQLKAEINFPSWDIPPVFSWLKKQGNLDWAEMLQIFNCGIGYILVVDQEIKDDILNRLKMLNQTAWEIGKIQLHSEKSEEQITVNFLDENK
ncbi:phosphoribosylformylglycinamidine cyclo-ligase [Desulfovibrio litoralis]|uniref:Phosphoribosylformylglycinamidine cyclo-ligase n=1 Tax=Desulfovibrio litoralis DSM 11393 TaxID=1121455 RepID=A0A1M7SPI7_9BACT|nr:phosphoribosylformylglycinamidine cyclo-ligase [Desulfovibrio litoralis]SHN60299.1 phosphoribosylformylglycinamidine cyclo-ligase [Desulfovibrio litoralis DSM 11393]